jgi:hypothetical protein
VRFITQSLDKIEKRIARWQLEGLAAGHKEGLAAGIPVWRALVVYLVSIGVWLGAAVLLQGAAGFLPGLG